MQKWFIGAFGLLALIWVVYVNRTTFFVDVHATKILEHKVLPVHFHKQIWLMVLRLHVVSASAAMLTGILGFTKRIFRQGSLWHRVNGRVYILASLFGALTAGYLAPRATGGLLASTAFNLMEAIWVVATIAAFIFIRKKQVLRHRAWMIRSYAMTLFNTSLHLWLFCAHTLIGIAYDTAYVLSLWMAVLVNLAMAEWIARRTYRLAVRERR
ncbi:DUF2306 domain-containing protein [Alicyclobacillus fodiniaquatilis]|uniref:DUF2306 domain-containing protein n=1 Tax=Alicyclobacillus fodiniaquatilis TaxID=1661150 RepID=A0ABW4JB88_9BACL